MKQTETAIQKTEYSSEALRKFRLRAVIRTAAVFLVAGIVYITAFRLFGTGIPCLFRNVTGLLCPACGMTRALAALSRGQFRQAMEYNALSVTLVPVFLLYLLYRAVRYVRSGYDSFRVPELLFLLGSALICFAYFGMRNHLI